MSKYPAFLFIGPEEACREKARELVMSVLCKKNSCRECTDCRAIVNKQHYLQMWINPDNAYTLSHLEPVFKVTSFALQPDEHYFIIFERADLFTHATANSLLKLLEEPPAGYHFILLSPRRDSILPTLLSRCVVELVAYSQEDVKHPFYRFFTAYAFEDIGEFSKELDRSKALERDIPLLLDQLAVFWYEQMRTAHQKGDERRYSVARAIENLVQESRLILPLAGSAKIFFKNLYLQFLQIMTAKNL